MIKDYARKDLAPRTMIRHKGIIEMHLRPELGSIPLRKLTPAHLRVQRHWPRAVRIKRNQKVPSCQAQPFCTITGSSERCFRMP
ncbi:MAG: hypothetical protein ACOY40_11975 [Bacillota bacterium]